MGDFTLYHKDRMSRRKQQAALACLARQGSENPQSIEHDSYVIRFFPKQVSPLCNFAATGRGDFCGSSGAFIYKGLMGRDALLALLDDFTVDHYDPGHFNGLFTVILKKRNRLFLLTDPLGGNRVYQNDAAGFWSSSFLAAASASDRLTVNKQALYEYAFQETTYGRDTVFDQVTSLDSLKIFEFTARGPVSHDKRLDFRFEPSPRPRANLIEETVDLLRHTVRPVAGIFGDRIRTALSGGYDSRLMLALLQDSGVRPGVYVYGAPDSPDVAIARAIADGENFPLDHINKGQYPAPADYPATVEDNFYGLDGLPGEGLFDFGANMDTRRRRAGGDHMVFNGGGGEIFRNFFYLPQAPLTGGRFTIRDLISSFYARYSRSFCTDAFVESDYRDSLHDKIKCALGAASDRLSRTEVEYAYPAFRLRYWTARDNNNNSRLGSYLTPFISYAIIRQALTIPLAAKNHGCFQADLIRAIRPALAAYPSDYGYPFDRPVPAKAKIRNHLTYLRPPLLRRYSYAIQHRMRGPLRRPRSLAPALLAQVLPQETPRMSRYFKIDRIKDAALLGRVYSLEYLLRHFGL